MAQRKPYTGPTKLILAFDIGTTFSGISYCILEKGQIPEILGVTRFPGQAQVDGDPKVPSLLYYDKKGSVRAAGAEVLTESVIETALTEEWMKAEWWKLHLCPKHLASSIDPDNDLPPLPSGKSTANVLSDFIKYLFRCAKTYIEEHHLAFSWSSVEHSVEYIFTHPNGWGTVRQLYLQAIERAGLIPSTAEGRSRVHMLTEGEAALYFCIANLVDSERVDQAVPQGVAIIDAGGATVDLSMFSMTSNPISCEEIALAECRLQGSVFVTRRARALLERKLEGWEHSTLDEIADFTREFDQSTKLIIKSDQEPAYVRVAGRRTSVPKYNILLGKLKLTGGEATGLFSDSIDAIIDAFEQQLKSAKMPITMAFLVGGFSTNDWVWSQLQSYFRAKDVNLCRPDNHINKTVANGAVLAHVECDRSKYSVVCVLPPKENDKERVRRKGQWEIDPTGDLCDPGYFESDLHQMVFRQSFTLTASNPKEVGMQTVRIEYFAGALSDPEQVERDQTSFSTLCTIRADLSEAVDDLVAKKTASGEVYYQLDYDVIVLFGLAVLQAQVGWKTTDGERR